MEIIYSSSGRDGILAMTINGSEACLRIFEGILGIRLPSEFGNDWHRYQDKFFEAIETFIAEEASIEEDEGTQYYDFNNSITRTACGFVYTTNSGRTLTWHGQRMELYIDFKSPSKEFAGQIFRHMTGDYTFEWNTFKGAPKVTTTKREHCEKWAASHGLSLQKAEVGLLRPCIGFVRKSDEEWLTYAEPYCDDWDEDVPPDEIPIWTPDGAYDRWPIVAIRLLATVDEEKAIDRLHEWVRWFEANTDSFGIENGKVIALPRPEKT